MVLRVSAVQSPTHTIEEPYIFRGVSDSAYPLTPGIMRSIDGSIKSKHSGVEISGTVYRSVDCESEILSHFKKEAVAISSLRINDSTFDWLQQAQHYGVPTRLLDFSANPLVALFFCCYGESDAPGAVWIVNISTYNNWMIKDPYFNRNCTREAMINSIIEYIELDKSERQGKEFMGRPIFFIPSYIDNRMSAQESRFLLWGTNINPLERMIEQENIMNLSPEGLSYEIESDQRFLGKIIIPAQCKHSLLSELAIAGISEKTIFPGLEGLGRYINRYYTRTPEDANLL